MKLKRVNFAKLAAMGMMGIAFGYSAQASLITHTVDDASFDDNPVDAGLGYSYWNGAPDTAWLSDGSWWYNSGYDAIRRPTPLTGDQALHGGGSYAWQELTDVFEAGRTYTFSVWTQGDSDADGASESIWLYLYDGTATAQPGDASNVTFVGLNSDGSFIAGTNSQDAGPFAGFNIGGDSNWTQVSLNHTVSPGAPEVGQPIGIGLYGRSDAAFDDVTVTSDLIPEPHVLSLLAIGGSLVFMVRRRK